MAYPDAVRVYAAYEKLDTIEKVMFLEWVHANDEHKYEYAKMTPNERMFYDEKAKRVDK